MSSTFTLEEYRIQREYRENKRKEYLKRFQLLKQKIPLSGSFNGQSNVTGVKAESTVP